jgi:hypothetical protein
MAQRSLETGVIAERVTVRVPPTLLDKVDALAVQPADTSSLLGIR